jgi:RNA polymerase sigma-70 factor, ECF subfamily
VVPVQGGGPELIKTAEDELSVEEDRREVVSRVMRLRPKLRVVVVAHELEGRPMPEVAASLGIPLKTAYARLRLARVALARSAASLRAG